MVSILKLCFRSNLSLVKTASSYKGSRNMCWHFYTQALLETTGADDDCYGGDLGQNSEMDRTLGDIGRTSR